MALIIALFIVVVLATQAHAFALGRWQSGAGRLSSSVHKESSSVHKESRLYMGEVYHDGQDCEQRLKDHNGRCPGHSGYVPQVVQNSTPSNFADFQKAMAEKKRKASDAKGLKK